MRVRGEGPKNATVMLIGEAPGAYEEKTGRPFVGPSGQELSRFLNRVDVKRNQCYVTNMLKERPPNNRDPSDDELRRDMPELLSELKRVQPMVIGALGRFSSRWATGVDDLDMETWHGLPVARTFPEVDHVVTVVPLYHPAAGLHNPALLGHVAWDIEQLAGVVRGEIRPPLFPEDDPFYFEGIEPLDGNKPWVAIDTEGTADKPWGLSYSQEANRGWVVRNRPVDPPYYTGKLSDLELFRKSLAIYLDQGGKVLLHNAPWDIPVLGAMGIQIPPEKIIDTMIAAYLLRLEPQGLKQLALRHCGMEMKSYGETMHEAGEKLARTYLELVLATNECQACFGTGEGLKELKTKMKLVKCEVCKGDGTAWPDPDPVLDWNGDSFTIRQPKRVGTRARAFLESGVDMAKGWRGMDEEVRLTVEGQVSARSGAFRGGPLRSRPLGPMPEPTLDDLEYEAAINYSGRDADATLRVWEALWPKIKAEGLDRALELDLGILPIVTEMMAWGMPVSKAELCQLAEDLEVEMNKTEAMIQHLTKTSINPGSGQQVDELLYKQMNAPLIGKPTKSGRPSTDNKTLEALKTVYQRDQLDLIPHPIIQVIDLVIAYRQAAKIRGTYALPLQRKAKWNILLESWRVHTRIKTTRTDTGRLSSADPNLQNIPTRTELGKRVRQAFVASPGMLMGAWDYDQIEMRVLAAESQDENLMRVFHEGIDIHAMTASLCFGIPIESVEVWQRRAAKIVGFGVVYGMSEIGLKNQLMLMGINWTDKQCKELIDLYLHEAYPGIGRYMRERHDEAMATGAVKDLFGRVRRLAGVGSRDKRVHAESVRQAGNMPIQSAAAGILKEAMLRVWHGLSELRAKTGVTIIPLMQIHDELVFEFDQGAEQLVNLYVKDAMEWEWRGIEFTVSGAWGRNWGECK